MLRPGFNSKLLTFPPTGNNPRKQCQMQILLVKKDTCIYLRVKVNWTHAEGTRFPSLCILWHKTVGKLLHMEPWEHSTVCELFKTLPGGDPVYGWRDARCSLRMLADSGWCCKYFLNGAWFPEHSEGISISLMRSAALGRSKLRICLVKHIPGHCGNIFKFPSFSLPPYGWLKLCLCNMIFIRYTSLVTG